MTFNGARARVAGATGLAGGGVSSTQLSDALANVAPSSAPYITKTSVAGLSAEQALDQIASLPGIAKINADGSIAKALGTDLPAHSHTDVMTVMSFHFDGAGATVPTGIWYPGGQLLPATTELVAWLLSSNNNIQITVQSAANAFTLTWDDLSGTGKPANTGGGTYNSNFGMDGWVDTSLNAYQRIRVQVDSVHASTTWAALHILTTRAI